MTIIIEGEWYILLEWEEGETGTKPPNADDADIWKHITINVAGITVREL